MANPHSSPRILLVEGRDDKHVIQHLSHRSESMPSFDIKDTDGIDQLLDIFEVEIDHKEKIVGIVLDANEDLKARWRAVTGRLGRIDSPAQPQRAGTIIDGKPRVGIWLMPNNQSCGELEDFVAAMIPDDDPVWPLSEQYIDGIPKKCRAFKSKKTVRAKVHAWLATREEPRKMGAAIRAQDVNIDGEDAISFVQWLRDLFE